MHDTVPGVLIALEAGAELVSFEDDEYRYKMLSFIIGTNNFIEIVRQHHSKILEIIS